MPMRPWKALAVKKLGLSKNSSDRIVLDEILRVDVTGGSTILRIRDHFAAWVQEQTRKGMITNEESAAGMAGVTLLTVKLRNHGMSMYMHLADTPDARAADFKMSDNESYQPAADYEDPKGEG